MARKGQKKQAKSEDISSPPLLWLKAVYHLHVFHYRMPETASIAALTSFVPSPLTVKMAMVASLLQKGESEKASQLVTRLSKIEIRIAPPSAAFSFKAFLRYRSVPAVESAGEMDETGSFYPSRPHTREFALFADDIVVFVGLLENDIRDVVEEALRRIRYLGCKDSLAWCREVSQVDLNIVEREMVARPLKDSERGVVVLLADFATDANIRDLKDIIPGQRKEELFVRPMPSFVLPGRILTRGQTRIFVKDRIACDDAE